MCKCGAGEMVRLVSVMFGRSQYSWGTPLSQSSPDRPFCSPHPGDCQAPDLEEHACIGLANCAINLPTGLHGRHLPGCDMYASYITVTYQCVPRERVVVICEVHRVTAQSGYITTPRYPHYYPNTTNTCTLEIDVHFSQRIYLYSIDFSLGDQCKDRLTLSGMHGDSMICRDRRVELLDSSTWGSLRLVFNKTSGSEHKGFWLYYSG